MADVHSVAVRSYNMAQIKSYNTKPEMIVRKYLFSMGIRYRVNVATMPGKPDIVMKKYKTVVFINGCFWHKHDCKYFVWPKTNKEFWEKKIERNVARDKEEMTCLENLGWTVLIVWECQLKKDVRLKTLEKLYSDIIKNGK